MKTVIKLLIAAAIVNAAYRGGSVAVKYFQFKDTVERMVLFGQSASVGELNTQILEEAEKQSVPLDTEGVSVTREGARTVAEIAYSETVELFPRYFHPIDLSFTAEAFGLAGADGARR